MKVMLTMNKLVNEIKELYHRDSEKCKLYNIKPILEESEIIGIKKNLLSGNYYLAPLRKHSNFNINTTNLCFDVIPASSADSLVFKALGNLLNKELGISFYRKSCYSKFIPEYYENIKVYTEMSSYYYLEAISEWSDIEALISLDCRPSVNISSRSRLLDKLRPIVDDNLLLFLSNYINLNVIYDNLDDNLELLDHSTCLLPDPKLGFELLNFILDDIDREFEERLPRLQHKRFYYDIIIPVYDLNLLNQYVKDIKDIFNSCNFMEPCFKCVIKRGETGDLPLGGRIRIDELGQCKVD